MQFRHPADTFQRTHLCVMYLHFKLRVSFCKRAPDYRALWQKETCKDKTSYASSPPCVIAAVNNRGIEKDRYRQSNLGSIPLGATFSNAVSKLKAQSLNVSLATFQWKEPFELWAFSFERASKNVTPRGIWCTYEHICMYVYEHICMYVYTCIHEYTPSRHIHGYMCICLSM